MSTPSQSVTFDRAVAYYDQTRGFPPGVDLDAAALMVRTAGITRSSVMVEIGVGTGRLALPLAQHSGPYIGVDLSAGMMDVLRGKQSQYPGGDLRLVRGDVMALPIKSSCADFAVLVHILHLIPDRHAAVRELARVLKPGGAAVAGWNRSQEPGLQPLRDAWEQATNDDIRFESIDAGPLTLSEAGWRLRVQDVLTYTTTISAHEKAENFRRRIHSGMWRMSDEKWRAGVDAVELALAKHFPDPHAQQRVEHSFFVAVYERP